MVHRMESLLKQQLSAVQSGASAVGSASASASGSGLTLESLKAELLGAISASTGQTNAAVTETKDAIAKQLLSEFSRVQEKLQSSTSTSADHQQVAIRDLLVMLHSETGQIINNIADARRELRDVAEDVKGTQRDVIQLATSLNQHVEQMCRNYDEVKDYVDKNIAAVKDFVGKIVKKLPLPARLEVRNFHCKRHCC